MNEYKIGKNNILFGERNAWNTLIVTRPRIWVEATILKYQNIERQSYTEKSEKFAKKYN